MRSSVHDARTRVSHWSDESPLNDHILQTSLIKAIDENDRNQLATLLTPRERVSMMFTLGSGFRGARLLAGLLAGRIASTRRLSYFIAFIPFVWLIILLISFYLIRNDTETESSIWSMKNGHTFIIHLSATMMAFTLPLAFWAINITKWIERKVITGIWHQELNNALEWIAPLRWFLPRAGTPGHEQRVYDRGDVVTALHIACAVHAAGAVSWLLANGALVNTRDGKNRLPNFDSSPAVAASLRHHNWQRRQPLFQLRSHGDGTLPVRLRALPDDCFAHIVKMI